MASRNGKSRQRFEPQDVGTLWTLRREEYTARCPCSPGHRTGSFAS